MHLLSLPGSEGKMNDFDKHVLEQPLDGLLYDLDLLPEQNKRAIDAMRYRVIKRLREKIDELETVQTIHESK